MRSARPHVQRLVLQAANAKTAGGHPKRATLHTRTCAVESLSRSVAVLSSTVW